MVSRILFALTLLMSNVAMSQDENGLTFNQVLLVNVDNEVIVPEGKVWKLMGTIMDSENSGTYYYINNNKRKLIHEQFPLWFPEFTSIQRYYNIPTEINVIEFNTD